MVVIREPKIFILVLILPKSFDKNLKHEIEFIIKSNESLAENKAKNKIEQYCPNRKDIHEHEKQQNEWTAQICCKNVTKIRFKKLE